MSLIEKQNYVIYDNGLMTSYKLPMKNIYGCTVSTHQYVFFVPRVTIGMFLLYDTIKNHPLFEGITIEEGIRKLINKTESVNELEKSLLALLENDEKYVFLISSINTFKFIGFWGKYTLKMSNGYMKHSTIYVIGKGKSKEFRTFHGQ